MRGSVTTLVKNRGYGCILGEDGNVIYFDEKALISLNFRTLSIGAWVEYEGQYSGERISAVKVRSIPSPMIGAGNRR
jgi:cold shock CspA family protein